VAIASRTIRRDPTMRFERRLLREGHTCVGGVDEVGRGAWAGPLMVGVVVADASTPRAPVGVRDSKMLTAMSRRARAIEIRSWSVTWSVGAASAGEIDEVGLSAALTLATARALDDLACVPSALLVDGSFDFVSPRYGTDTEAGAIGYSRAPSVQTLVRGDQRSACIAAASILAKVTRDALMEEYGSAMPDYGFERHKGYGTRGHRGAVDRHGLTSLHRASWRFAASPELGEGCIADLEPEVAEPFDAAGFLGWPGTPERGAQPCAGGPI
jgi:ribonuclease HII